MPISADSRYANATITTGTGPSGDTRQVMSPAFPTSSLITYTYYRIVGGERVDTIAKDFYGRGELWWMIAHANPEIMDWLAVDPGTVIRIPNV